MKKELIPTIFDNSEGTYLRLEFFKNGENVDRITIKINKDDEENIKKFIENYSSKN